MNETNSILFYEQVLDFTMQYFISTKQTKKTEQIQLFNWFIDMCIAIVCAPDDYRRI